MGHVLGLTTHARESMCGGLYMESRTKSLLGKIEVMNGNPKHKEKAQASVQKGRSTMSNPGRGYRYRSSGEPTPLIQKDGL